MKSTHHIRNRMRWLIVSLGMMWTMLASAQSNINKIEYFFDADPGFGLGTNVTVASPGTNISALSFTANLPANGGFHTFYVRSRTAAGAWSMTNSSYVVKFQAQTATLGPSSRINKMEYFFDTDPGFGLGNNVPVTASTDINSLSVPVSITSLTSGFHVLYVRSRDSLGRWSMTNSSNFLKYAPQTVALGPVVPVNKVEYFFDIDPGFGLGTNVPVTAGTDINGLAIPVSIAPLNSGFHTFYIRSRDSLGRWSVTNYSNFLKYAPQTAALGPVVNINKMEYFIDNDPGFGLATNVPVTSATDINGMAVSVNIAAINAGLHTLYIRTRDSLGRWSMTNNGVFIRYQAQTAALGPLVKIKKLEYFIDIDPGVGNATTVSVTPTLDLNNYVFAANLSTVSSGAHKLYVRSMDSLGRWSLTNYGSFNGGTLQAPTATITVVGTQPLCAGTGYLRVNRDASPIATYQWKLGTTNVGTNDTIFYPTASGTYTVVVTNTVSSATSAPVTVSVLPAPTANISAGGPLSFCQGSSVVLSVNQTSGASYSWKQNGSTIGGATASTYTATSSGIYTVVVTGSNNCPTASAKDTVTVTPSVTPTIVVTANQTSICTGTVDSFFATITNGGTNPTYTWKKNGVTVGSNSRVYVNSTLANNDTIYCILTSNAVCATPAVLTSNKIIMTVSSVSAPSVSITPTAPSICSGSQASFSASPLNGGTNPTYQWYVNGTLQGSTSNPFVTTTLSNNDSVWVVMTSNSSCASQPTATSNHAHVSVSSTVTPSVTIAATSLTLCASAVDTFTATPVNGGASPSYQWYKNGIFQGGNTTGIFITSLSNNDSVWVVMTSSAACPSPSTATSNHVRVNVVATVVPTIVVTASQNTICAGDSVTFTAAITNGGANPVYQWKKNNVNVGTNSATYGSRTLANNDSVWCVLTSNATCAAPATVASAHQHITVNQVTAPAVTIQASQTSICSGTTVNFYAVPNNGGSNPTYQWYKNSVLQAATGSPFSTSTSANNDTIWCVMTSNSACASTPTAMSNKIVVTVNPTVAPSVSITASFLSICTSTSDTFRATPVNGGAAPTYQWFRNGVLQAGNTATFITTSLSNNDSVWVVMTSSAACPSPATAISNKARITVNSYVTPTISVTALPTSICSGDSVTYTASTSNGGGAPTYVWKKNGITVGTNSPIFGTRTILSTDSVWCILTSNVPCPTIATVTSNKVRITVNTIVVPTISVTASQSTICAGANVTFTASITNGGANPSYAWYKNGALVSVGSSTYSDNTLANNDSVWCILTSNNACASPASVTSSHIIITITSSVSPSVSVTTPLTTVCAGTSVTFTANPVNGGTSPSYQWYKNGVLQAGNLGTYTPGSLSNNDSVWVIMTSNAACVSPATATSAHIRMTVTPIVAPTITVTAVPTSICAGDSVTFTASITNGGANPTYQWKKNGVNVGTGTSTYGIRNLASTDSVWCVLTSNATCASPAVVSSNHVRITVNSVVAPTVTVNASQTTICAGNTVNFTTTITNGGSNPSYQWYKNGILVSTAGSSYNDNTLVNNDSVWVVLTSSNACASPASATSSHIIITITTAVVPSVSVTASQTTICAGTSVTFTAHPTNGGSNPTYQWYRNGVLQSGNSATFSISSLANNDSVWCIMTSNAQCVSPATATSAHVLMTVNPIVTPTISVSVSPATICAGDSVTFTASISNGGANPTYQWIKNGVNVGSGSAIYGTRNISSTDSVWCILSSTAPCPSPTSVSSNHVRVTVNPIVAPTITISASQTTICAGNTVNFTSSITNGGSNPSYQWYKNGVLVSTSGSSYSNSSLANNDSVWVVLTSSNACASPSSATSSHIIITLTTTVVPSVSVTASDTISCAGTSVTFTAHPVNGGSPSYQWYKNGVLQAGNTATYAPSSLSNSDSVWVIMTSTASCVSPATATSAHVVLTVNPTVLPTIAITASPTTICAGDSATYTASITNGGSNPTYQWKKNGANVGIGGNTYGTRNISSTDSVWCVLVSNAPCASPAIVSSNHLRITVNPIVTPGITISATQTTVCAGSVVTFTAQTSDGGFNPAYQWYRNGSAVGANTATYTDSNFVTNDSVWCILTSTATCAAINTAISNILYMTLTGTVVPSVVVSTVSDTVCLGSSVTFTASLTNGGLNPQVQWYRNGVLQAASGSTYAINGLTSADSVWAVLTSSVTCASPSTAASAHILMSVTQPSYYSYSASICPGSSYVFNGQTLTQAGTYADTLTAVSTCDSIVTLTLNIYAQPFQIITASICPGDSFDFRGVTIYQGGTYDDTLTAAGMNGCDSIIRLSLSIRPILTSARFDTICYGSTLTFGGYVLAANGTYSDTLTGSNGCDSISTVYLTVSPQVTSSFSAYTCQGYAYNFHGQQLTTAGTYVDTVQSSRGCDSIVTLALTVRSNIIRTITDTVCQGTVVAFHGIHIGQTGTYYDTLTSANGCDSILILRLVVNPKPTPVASLQGIAGLQTTAYASYQWLFNNTVITGATAQTHTATQNGSYRVIVFNSYGCSDTSVAVSVTRVGIENVTISNLHIYPNPAENTLHIEAEGIRPDTKLVLIDAIGRTVYEKSIIGDSISDVLDISSYASGVYILIFKDADKVYVSHRIVKN